MRNLVVPTTACRPAAAAAVEHGAIAFCAWDCDSGGVYTATANGELSFTPADARQVCAMRVSHLPVGNACTMLVLAVLLARLELTLLSPIGWLVAGSASRSNGDRRCARGLSMLLSDNPLSSRTAPGPDRFRTALLQASAYRASATCQKRMHCVCQTPPGSCSWSTAAAVPSRKYVSVIMQTQCSDYSHVLCVLQLSAILPLDHQVGCLDGGVAALRWSPGGETLCLITMAGQMLLMTKVSVTPGKQGVHQHQSGIR